MKSTKAPRLRIELAFAYLLPLPALVGGLIWAAALIAISGFLLNLEGIPLVTTSASGETTPAPLLVLAFTSSLMWAILPAIARISAASEIWDQEGLLPPDDARPRWQKEKQLLAEIQPPGIALLPATLLGIVVGIAIDITLLGANVSTINHPSLAWASLLLIGLFMLLFRGIAFTRLSRKRRQSVYLAAEKVNLLDLTPQHRAARSALRSCMTWLAGASISSFFFLIGGHWLTTMVLTGVTLIAAFSLLPPVVKMQRRIHQAKVKEIARLQVDVRLCRDATLGLEQSKTLPAQDIAQAPPGRLADLLSYLHHIENLPELPFDKGRLAIASLYFAVPLGSWVWISLVQKLLGVTLS